MTLIDHKGQYVERASSLEPWIHRFDMKIAQDFYAKIGSRKYGIQVSLDMLNIGNLLNSKWGAYRSCGLQSYDNVRLLKTASKVGEPLTYQMNASSREVFQKNSKWDYTASTGSAWQMQLGVKMLRSINGASFLFHPHHHRIMVAIIKIRREVIRTIQFR